MRQSSSSSPDWERPSPPERSRSGSHQPKPTRWQGKKNEEDGNNTQKREDWEKWSWEDWQSQSWEQQGWEEQWHGQSNAWWEQDVWEERGWPWKGEWSEDWTDWSWEDKPQGEKKDVAKTRRSPRQQPNLRQLSAEAEAGQNEKAKPTPN